MTLTLVLSVLATGLFIGFKLPYWYAAAVYSSARGNAAKGLTPTEVDENRLCYGPHSWTEATIADGAHYSTVNVCEKCGFIPNRNLMASPEGIKRVIEHKKRIEQELAFENEFLSNEQKEYETLFAEEIKNGLSVDKLFKVYGDGQTSYKRYVLFKLAKLESTQETNGKEARPY